MTLAEQIASTLMNDPTLAALIGKRCYPLHLPELLPGTETTSLPALTYQRVSMLREYSHDGYSGLARPRVQISCWATDYLTTERLTKAVLAAMKTFPGAEAMDQQEMYEPDTGIYHTAVDVAIWHKES